MPLQILGLGASTPIGRNVWASAAAARAGVCGFFQHPYMLDTAGEPMRVARTPWLDVGVDGSARLTAMLLPAMNEALSAIADDADSLSIGLALGLPAHRPGRVASLAEDVIAAVHERWPNRFERVACFEVGHAAGYLALAAAQTGCARGAFDACVVAGVDSYMTPETLEWVEACDQLHGGGPLNNAWGFVPGEAAGALLVGPGELAHRHSISPFAEVLSVGLGMESKRIKTDHVCIGEGLTQAFREALKGLPQGALVHNVYCDLNGEPYRADEFGFAALRTGEHFRSACDFIAPADCWGDVGASSAPLHVALAIVGHLKSYAHGSTSFAWASSEGGERGAALLRASHARGASL